MYIVQFARRAARANWQRHAEKRSGAHILTSARAPAHYNQLMMSLTPGPHRDDVFVAGGQPTITYVERKSEHIELNFARALATPNQIVSLSGPTKTGKTVLCHRSLGDRQFVWIDGGQIKDGSVFWDRIVHELRLPSETSSVDEQGAQLEVKGSLPLVVTAGGSRLLRTAETTKHAINSMGSAMSYMTQNGVMLVIDDFHYIAEDVRTELMRNVKGAVFNGLKVILLSVTHRVFDAIKAESELTGRFTAISLPEWSGTDLAQIPKQGFEALNADCPKVIIDRLCVEAQENPFLMQKFCWEICFHQKIERRKMLGRHAVLEDYDLAEMFKRLAVDAGLPIYQKLAAGPQSRKRRAKRPLRRGGVADIYQAVLLALAESGPKAAVSYEELRSILSGLLSEQVPQKHEITSALKHLAKIALQSGAGAAIDWDEGKREINVVDPYLRFYLRWQVRGEGTARLSVVPQMIGESSN